MLLSCMSVAGNGLPYKLSEHPLMMIDTTISSHGDWPEVTAQAMRDGDC
jgi:hypothetical protein